MWPPCDGAHYHCKPDYQLHDYYPSLRLHYYVYVDVAPDAGDLCPGLGNLRVDRGIPVR